jgi:polyisoprenoid-binding protein YceI
MRRAFKFLFGALALVVVVAIAFTAWYVLSDNAPAKPKLSDSKPSAAGGPATPVGTWRVTPGTEVYVGYRIKELFGDSVLKRDAAGRTPAVTGTLTVAPNKLTAATVTADVTKLDSGRAARDAYTRDNALETGKFMTARFTLAAPVALPTAAKGKQVHVTAPGTLLLHGVTKPVTITIDARWNGPTIEAVGTAPITLADFGIDAPDTPIAKVDDHGSLEFALKFAPAKAAAAKIVNPAG